MIDRQSILNQIHSSLFFYERYFINYSLRSFSMDNELHKILVDKFDFDKLSSNWACDAFVKNNREVYDYLYKNAPNLFKYRFDTDCFWYIFVTPILTYIALSLWLPTMICAFVVGSLYGLRALARLQKKLDDHVSDETIHVDRPDTGDIK